LTSQPKVTVTPGAVSGANSTVGFASTSVKSGRTDAVAIVVKDAAGNAVTGLESVQFNFSLLNGTSTGIFGPISATATPGTSTATLTGLVAGSASSLSLTNNHVQVAVEPKVTVLVAGV